MSTTTQSKEEGAATAAPNLFAVRGFTKSFGAIAALQDVDFEVSASEVVALVGDNGAGKSTLIKAIAGIQPADTGQAYFEGEPVHLKTPQDATKLGIATVYQDLALADNLDVVANLFLGHERIGKGPDLRLDEVNMEQQSSELLSTLSVRLPSIRAEAGMLSGGQRQSVAIARSLLGEPRVVLLDEPTAALGVAQTAQVLALIKRLRERGLGVVVISHNLADVFEVADRIVVLRLGRRVAAFDRSASQDQVVAAITGADIRGNGREGAK
jgi:D-xylose transport system ATP-binding protein